MVFELWCIEPYFMQSVWRMLVLVHGFWNLWWAFDIKSASTATVGITVIHGGHLMHLPCTETRGISQAGGRPSHVGNTLMAKASQPRELLRVAPSMLGKGATGSQPGRWHPGKGRMLPSAWQQWSTSASSVKSKAARARACWPLSRRPLTSCTR